MIAGKFGSYGIGIYCFNVHSLSEQKSPTHRPQCPIRRRRKRKPPVSTRPARQPVSTCISMRPWMIQSTKPKPMFSTRRSRKLAWGNIRSLANKFSIFNFFELPLVVSLRGSRFWLGCVRCSSSACIKSHSEIFFVLFSDSGALVCPVSTYKVHDDPDPVQGPRWQYPLPCTSRIPLQACTSFPFNCYWFFYWCVRLGTLDRYLGTKVCILPH